MDFDWRRAREQGWLNRYPLDTVGRAEWQREKDPRALLDALEGRRHGQEAPLPRPTLFISHRQTDVALALQAAKVARDEDLDVWLDVLDPVLGDLEPGSPAYSWAIACIIEMALLNSTHLLAVVTPDTNGSQWVPYEFGRVKARLIVAANASSWLIDLAATGVPEYLLLCPVWRDLQQVRWWLRHSRVSAHRTGLRQVASWPSS
jgi:hypothetical protein